MAKSLKFQPMESEPRGSTGPAKKIDQEDFRNSVCKVKKDSQKRMDLSELDEKLEA
jgi:hypothetical protein